jgi:hypothetical protein
MITEEQQAKRREKDRARRARIKADPELHAKLREKERARSKRRYAANPEYYSAKNARWFREHRDWDNERHRRLYAANPDKYREQDMRKSHRSQLDKEDWAALIARLKGPCDICGVAQNGKWKRMHIDHDHVADKFRGVLCHRCNVALGYLDDDAGRLRKAAEYLERG